jgi:hypothetical protein
LIDCFIKWPEALNASSIELLNDNFTKEKKMALEKFDKRFGVIAIEKGFITPEQLVDAIKIQITEDLGPAIHRLVGEILLENGHITAEQINDVLESMEKEIID